MFPVARHLAEVIGPRPAGSPGECEAALYLAGLFRGKGFDVELQPFHFINWTPVGRPVLKVLAPDN
jgi:hypothetical protein